MNKNILFLLFTALLSSYCKASFSTEGRPPISDYSGAGADGPHVFYQSNRIVVKSVVLEDSIPIAQKSVYKEKSQVGLTCIVPGTGDSFSFPLSDTLPLYPAVYPETPEKILVISDIEGDFEAFKTILQGAKVIDDQFSWTYGKGHLVLLGDYFDRGLNVTECLWLAYKMDMEARTAGGRVHFILGNHEVMNLAGDTRYVRNKYFENADLIGEKYETWYAPNTELGRWLYSKNAIERIGDYIFCHGGISADMASSRMNIDDINRIARRWYGTPYKKIDDPDASLIFNPNRGIFWYREMAQHKMPVSDVNYALFRYSGKRIVVGHTLTADIRALYNGKVILVDLQHEELLRQGYTKALWINNGLAYCLDSKGNKTAVMLSEEGSKANMQD